MIENRPKEKIAAAVDRKFVDLAEHDQNTVTRFAQDLIADMAIKTSSVTAYKQQKDTIQEK